MISVVFGLSPFYRLHVFYEWCEQVLMQFLPWSNWLRLLKALARDFHSGSSSSFLGGAMGACSSLELSFAKGAKGNWGLSDRVEAVDSTGFWRRSGFWVRMCCQITVWSLVFGPWFPSYAVRGFGCRYLGHPLLALPLVISSVNCCASWPSQVSSGLCYPERGLLQEHIGYTGRFNPYVRAFLPATASMLS